MLSIDNTYAEAGLREFISGLEKATGGEAAFVVEPKIDGLSLALWYEGPRLVRALTRGDDRSGRICSASASSAFSPRPIIRRSIMPGRTACLPVSTSIWRG